MHAALHTGSQLVNCPRRKKNAAVMNKNPSLPCHLYPLKENFDPLLQFSVTGSYCVISQHSPLMAMNSPYFTSSKFLTFETFFKIKPLTELQEAQVHIIHKLAALSCQVDISARGTWVSVVYESFKHSKFFQDTYSLCLFKYFNSSFIKNKLISLIIFL